MSAQARSLNPALGRTGIIWVASYPKSGNTWMRVFLYHLSRIAGGEETGDGGDLRQIGASEAGRLDLFGQVLGKPATEATVEEIAKARPAVQALIAAETGALAMTKTHNALGSFQGVPTIDMSLTAGAIYVIRNPLDIAASLADHFDTPIDEAIERMCTDDCVVFDEGRAVYEFWGSWSQHVASWTGTPHPQIMPVRYEDMITMPTAVFRAVANFLGKRVTDRQLTEAIRLSSFDRLREVERSGGFNEIYREGQQFFRKGRAGTWRDTLSEAQIGRLVRKHHLNMQRVGYMTPDLVRYLS